MAEVLAVLGTVASVAQLAANCKRIGDFISRVIRETGEEDSVKTLRADIESLSAEVKLVAKKCNQAQHPSSPFRIEQSVLEIFEDEKLACHETLKELEKLLAKVSGGSLNPSSFARYRQAILTALRSSELEELQKRVTKHQQQLHFYVSLISESKLDELLRRIPSRNSSSSGSTAPSFVDVPIPPSPRDSRTSLPPMPFPSRDASGRHSHSLRRSQTAPEPTQATMAFVDGLRPPGLVYRGRLFTKRLFRSRCSASAISGNGQFVGWFSGDMYEIYEVTTNEEFMACTGKLKKGKYYYGRNKPELKHVDERMTPGISCAALSDKYIAVGCHGTILIFALQGDSPGRWLSSAKVDGAQIEKLVFSSNGDELLALLKAKNSCDKALIYSASDFANDSRYSDEKAKPLVGREVAEWKDSVCEIADAAFSRDGTKIVICTGHDNKGKSQIRILKKYSEKGWRKYGHSISLPVLERHDASPGMTGISFFDKEKDIVCGLQTSFEKANDWHRIQPKEGKLTLRPRETTVASDHTRSKILAITVSPEYNAVALASLGDNSREFLLEFKQQCHEPLCLVLNSTLASFGCKLVKPITFSFSECGTRLILLTGEVLSFPIHG